MFQEILQGGGGTPKGVIDEKYLLFSDGEIFNDALKLNGATIQDKKIIIDGNNTYTKGIYVNTQTLPLVIIFESSRGGQVQTGTGNANGILPDIALYGTNLQGHYNAMRRTMMAFGMPISEINMEYGQSEYVDIYLDY